MEPSLAHPVATHLPPRTHPPPPPSSPPLAPAEAPGRQAAFHADLGRSLAHLRGREAQAVAALLTAEEIAPQRIHANAPVRNPVAFLTDRQLPAHAARDLRGLAHRIGLPL
ncbi:hypothetical protein [Streptomyces actinomycinicus]|uniref:hypothetical protein n=1 Tax=Streptomyces actinomycinicus TaxID=1695166 RepID=UPI001F29D90C|nr:hypothetical protein [Streptomyces actinomycinicus]